MWNKVSVLVTLIALGATYGAKLSPCQDNSNCRDGYFCDVSRQLCVKCQKCEDLRRESRPSLSSCVTSVSECGPCLEGLVADQHRDLFCVEEKVVLPVVETDTNNYIIWAVVGIFIGALFVAALYFIYKYVGKQNLLKVNVDTNMQAMLPAPASAPESQPPPYNYDPYPNQIDTPLPSEGSDLIKRYQPPQPYAAPQENQKTNAYWPPNYVHHPQQPQTDEQNTNVNEQRVDENAEYNPRYIPQEPNNNNGIYPHEINVARPAVLPPSPSPSPPPRRSETDGDLTESAALATTQNTNLIPYEVTSPPIQMQNLSRRGEENNEGYSETRYTQNGDSQNNAYNIMINVHCSQGNTFNKP